ncbi:MAG: hypothetical protein ACREYF_15385 [Gammaproteobacteria bacterium]
MTRLAKLDLPRVTLDFDGSVIGTGRVAEGTAVGFNRKKKGQRSYYPLFYTVAQTGQVLDVLHRGSGADRTARVAPPADGTLPQRPCASQDSGDHARSGHNARQRRSLNFLLQPRTQHS